MTDTDTDLIAFSGLSHAQRLSELFKSESVADNFRVYLDEMIHSDPAEAVDAENAGRLDARKTPPDPDIASEGPLSGSYVAQLYFYARKFFDTYLDMCEACFNSVATGVREILQRDFLPPNCLDTSELERAIQNCREQEAEFEAYKDQFKRKIGNRVLDPTKPLMMVFAAQVMFVVVFEFVLVWYFLSEQLGLAGAIYVSLVATTLVVFLAALCAFSQAYTSKDLEPTQVFIGYGGVALCILLFVFGLGLLSGWRADSTKEGFELIGAGFAAFFKIDVFVTAIFNFVGFVFLAWEFKRYFWPSPLFHYGQRKKRLQELEEEKEDIREELRERLIGAREALQQGKNEVDQLLFDMDEFQRNSAQKLKNLAKDLHELAANYQGKYAAMNREYRTLEAYAAPAWLDVCSLRIDGANRRESLQKHLEEYRKDIGERHEAFIANMEPTMRRIDEALDNLNLLDSA